VTTPVTAIPVSEALLAVQKFGEAGVRILGVDGFEVVPDGLVARTDLILDLSGADLTIEEAAEEAASFLCQMDRPGRVWEICTDVQ